MPITAAEIRTSSRLVFLLKTPYSTRRLDQNCNLPKDMRVILVQLLLFHIVVGACKFAFEPLENAIRIIRFPRKVFLPQPVSLIMQSAKTTLVLVQFFRHSQLHRPILHSELFKVKFD